MYAFYEMIFWEGIDKRKFPRVKYKCLIRVADRGKEELFDAYTENIGAGGLCVILSREFDLFKTADLELYVAEKESSIKCKGTIVWVIRRVIGAPASYEYDIGIEFTDMAGEDRNKISLLVDDVLSA
ncbi:MAG: PilZ domain-containing protein [Candidatus Omnitrophica bacterium]|nr:PilZ domain-containing protein [Candidatus Omnitrophota bacterium]